MTYVHAGVLIGFLSATVSANDDVRFEQQLAERRTEYVRWIADTFGELDAIYSAADLAFVGRSLTQHGGQNILEPAALGKPVVFGPHTENFNEATRLLLDAGAGVRVESEAGLREQIIKFLHDREPFVQIGISAREAVEKKKGATEKNLALLEEVIDLST